MNLKMKLRAGYFEKIPTVASWEISCKSSEYGDLDYNAAAGMTIANNISGKTISV